MDSGWVLKELEGLVQRGEGGRRLLIFAEDEEGIQLGSHAHSGVLSGWQKGGRR